MEYKTTQVWEVKVSWIDKEDDDGRRLLRRDLVNDTFTNAFQKEWNADVVSDWMLTDEGIEEMPSIPDLEERALSIVSDCLQDNDALIITIGDITTKVQGGYDARVHSACDESPEYDGWYSTYSNVQNRILAKFMHQQFYPHDFSKNKS